MKDPINGVIFSKDETLILTYSYDGTARLWNAQDGSPAAQPMKHESDVNGARFNKDETLILTYSDDGTARLWNISVDYDFPAEYLPLLVEVSTGTTLNEIGNVRILKSQELQQKRKEFIKIAESYLKKSDYKNSRTYKKIKSYYEFVTSR